MERRIRSAIILAIISFAFALAGGCSSPRAGIPRAASGLLDLSGYSLEKNGPVALDGDWEFYWGRFVDPASFPKSRPAAAVDHIAVPAFWNGHRAGNKTIGATGFATYRLTVTNSAYRGLLGFRIAETATACTLFVNGKQVYACGRPGRDRESARPRWLGDAVYFNTGEDTLDIVLHVSNYHYIRGGVFMSLRLGTAGAIKTMRERSAGIEFFVFGSLFIMGLYHLGLASLRRKDRAPLFFGIFCLIIALRTVSSGEHYLAHVFSNAPWALLHKIEYLSFAAAIPVFAFYIYSLFPEQFHRRILNVITWTGGIITLLIIATPSLIYSHTARFYQLFTLLSMVYAVYILVRAALRGTGGSAIVLSGFLVMAIAVVNDLLYENGIIQTGYATHFGLFFFIFSQSFLLLLRYSRAFDRIEKLTDKVQLSSAEIEKKNVSLITTNRELEELKGGLEKMVHKRTEELNHTLGELSIANESLKLLSSIDELTGIKNRRIFNEIIEYQWRQSARQRQPLSLLMIDIDHFKSINDTYGHLAGDECLKVVAGAIGSMVRRSSDSIARYGGEEFAVILPLCGPDDARCIAESVRERIASLRISHLSHSLSLTVSIGVASVVGGDEKDLREFIGAADGALYHAKRNGRNRVSTIDIAGVYE